MTLTILKNNDVVIRQKLTKILVELGFTSHEASIIIFLSKNGPKGVSEISLKVYPDRTLHRTECYRILNDLSAKGVVRCNFTKPYTFEVLPFGEVFDLSIDSFRVRASLLSANRDCALELLDRYCKIEVATPEVPRYSFMKLNGDYVYVVANRLIEASQYSIKLYVDEAIFYRLHFSGFMDKLGSHSDLSKVLLCGDSAKCLSFAHEYPECFFSVSCGFPSFLLIDEREVVVFGDGAIWCNEINFVQTYNLIANQLKDKGVVIK